MANYTSKYTGAQHDAAVAAFLNGAGGSSVAVDTTLKVSGAAADAKAVGDAFAELKSRTSTLETKAINTAEDIASLQQGIDELETGFVELVFKVVMRLVQLERHLGLHPPVSDDMDTNVGVEGSYDELFGQN